VELPEMREGSIHRVATRSSTKNRVEKHRSREQRGKGRSRSSATNADLDLSDSNHSIRMEPIQPVVNLEKGVGRYPIPIDISQEVSRSFTSRKLRPNQQKINKNLLIWILQRLFLQFFVDLDIVNKMVNKFLLI